MERLAVGLMSGTSVDGIDAALVKIKGHGENTEIELLHYSTYSYNEEMKKSILAAMDPANSTVAAICSLNFKLGKQFAEAVKRVCMEADVPLAEIDVIGSHGQTIYHIPQQEGDLEKSTLQIGEPAIISYETGSVVVSNFRTMDMAAGGEGAPLVPYTEYILYRNPEKNRALQNIGGIGNVTVIQKDAAMDDVFAFDTGPGNMIMDELCKHFKGISYDPKGKIAAEGNVQHELVDHWLSMDYFLKEPPKSTGRELFGADFTSRIIQENPHLSPEDLIATATYFTAASIAKSCRDFVFPKTPIDELIVGGGGSYNQTLLAMLKELLPEVMVMTQEEIGLSSEAKEAVAFALLANETIHQQCSNIPNATGASKPVILGNITLPPNGDAKNILQKAGNHR
ncbi:anhydro-N-acetylmuramic acid kinase AnmK [Falsibacillus pallidus]|uniref:Anhydro-N-acetylmuramic acid kinase n=1 Tax=Falsibacillus pallidus TaxID=493781 RepID=A0A370GE69_9BACI|nr:anhydro-N-acetylmuramic acid kinase AnmK [Falsibacillus pallidus]RDI41399.1 anhydro-N-acetylmuramic acid kinase [Falsibacillus pallidus]